MIRFVVTFNDKTDIKSSKIYKDNFSIVFYIQWIVHIPGSTKSCKLYSIMNLMDHNFIFKLLSRIKMKTFCNLLKYVWWWITMDLTFNKDNQDTFCNYYFRMCQFISNYQTELRFCVVSVHCFRLMRRTNKYSIFFFYEIVATPFIKLKFF